MDDPKQIVLDYMDEVARLEKKLKNAKESMIQKISAIKDIDINNKFISWFYWDTELPTSILQEAICFNKDSMYLRAGKSTVPYPCYKCGRNLLYEVTSREARKKKIADLKNMNKHYQKDIMCPECANKIKQEKLEAKIKKDSKNKELFKKRYAKMPYDEYLQTTHWKNFSERIKYERGNKCEKCGSKYDLETHHKTYEHRGYENDEDVIVLCHSCHSKEHGKKPMRDSTPMREKFTKITGLKLYS